MRGTNASEVINGLAGDDSIYGNGGDDTLNGGSGNDTFYIGGTSIGRATYNGGDGADRIRLSSDVTTSSLLLTSAYVNSTETLDFSIYDIEGTGANDIINISGITYASSYDRIYLYDGNDTFTGYVGNDLVDGGSGNDVLNGGAGNDSLTGGSGDDTLNGGSGDDTFYIGGTEVGRDNYNGGDGADRIRLSSDVTTSSLLLTSAYVNSTETLDFSIYDIEGTGANDIINISGITYASSYDRIYLYDGNDTFTGYVGNDLVDGGSGNDVLNGGAGNDSLTGGSGDDTLNGGSGDDTFYIGGTEVGRDNYNGGDGADRIRLSSDVTTSSLLLTSAYVNSTETLDFSIYDIEGTGANDIINISGITYASSYDRIYLYDGNDTFTGYVGNDLVDGGSGNDVLNGGAGNDSLTGDSGNDTLIGGAGDDRLDGGDGFDLLGYGAATGGIRVNLSLTSAQVIGGGQGTDTLLNIENVNGSRFADALTGNAAANVLNGGAGNDVLNGGAGRDTLNGGAGKDTLNGGAGNDVLNGGAGIDTATFGNASGGITVDLALTARQFIGGGYGSDQLIQIENVNGSRFADALTGNAAANVLNGGAGNDTLSGAAGHDMLNGGAGADQLRGGAGNDTLNGGAGADTLAGGAGADIFVFGVSQGADRVTDWQNGIDGLRIQSGSWQGVRYDSFDDLRIGQQGANAVITLGGTVITLANVNAGQLDASDFTFV
ncbi:MAG: calcium-binding protein [Paracoccus sp. (in: a-proteobacteria)]|uniref:beta strand repeat-containing protein n=1 Tax=Paracoccus sp. TaxID=267 RepID=UPI0039E5DB46